MKPPFLETERLVLRELTLRDAESYQQQIDDWAVARTLPKGFPWPYPADGGEKFIEKALMRNNPALIWAIALKENREQMIGILEMRPNQDDNHRGFWLGSAYHGNGFMSEAAEITQDYWFNHLDMVVLRVANARGNDASHRLKNKIGRLVRVEDAEYNDPSLTQREVWEITAADWQVYKAKLKP